MYKYELRSLYRLTASGDSHVIDIGLRIDTQTTAGKGIPDQTIVLTSITRQVCLNNCIPSILIALEVQGMFD